MNRNRLSTYVNKHFHDYNKGMVWWQQKTQYVSSFNLDPESVKLNYFFTGTA